LIEKLKIDEVFFAYSDISYSELMNKAALAMASGASSGSRSIFTASRPKRCLREIVCLDDLFLEAI